MIRFISDAAKRTAAKENGELHFGAFGAIPNVDIPRLEEIEEVF